MSAKFAPVAPIHILAELQERNVLGNYHLLLAHDVVEHADEYKRVFDTLWMDNPFANVILDNSVVELGNAVVLDAVAEACKIVRPNVVVLPDVYLDGKATMESCASAHGGWQRRLEPILGRYNQLMSGVERKWGFMYVPQGKTLGEFVRCAELYAVDTSVVMWGVPRNFADNVGSRAQAVRVVHTLNATRPIHMLGFSEDMVDDITVARDMAENYRIWGIDSAVPLRMAHLDMRWTLSPETKLPPRGDWWEKGEVSDLMLSNLRTVRRQLGSTL